MTEEVRGIGPNELDRRVPEPRRQDELGRLARTLNGLLSRVEGAVVRERAFITSAAHDLRTPIASLRTALELADGSGGGPDALRAEVHDALGDALRLSDLADGLLRLAEVQADGTLEPPEAVDVSELLAAAARDVAWEAGTRNIRIEIDSPPVTAFLGRVHLSQAVGNLLLNAVRHGAGGEPVEVVAWLALAAGDGASAQQVLRVEVRDRGLGIDPSRKRDLFLPFAARHGRAATPGGLGLATAAAAVSIEGGQIGQEDRRGGGSIFWFTLPLRDPRGATASGVEATARGRSRPAVGSLTLF
jgi:signal transduction histidine kinase